MRQQHSRGTHRHQVDVVKVGVKGEQVRMVPDKAGMFMVEKKRRGAP